MAESNTHRIAAARHAASLSHQIANGAPVAAAATLEHLAREFEAWLRTLAGEIEATTKEGA